MTRPRTLHAPLIALLSAAALLWVQAAAPRAPGLAADAVDAAGAQAHKGLAQLYRQDTRVARVLDRSGSTVDLAKVLAGLLGRAPALPVRLAPSVVAESASPSIALVAFPCARSSRGPPRA